MDVETARRLATEAHRGQLDKAGDPYIGHPLRVAARLSHDDEQVVALLHDVLEDTPLGVEDLAAAGATDAQLRALVLLCHEAGVDDETYWRRICDDPLARMVKIADLADNTDPARSARLDEATAERLRDKYRRALRILAWDEEPNGDSTRPPEWPRMREILLGSVPVVNERDLQGVKLVKIGNLPEIPSTPRPDPVDLDGVEVDETWSYHLLESEFREEPGRFRGKVRRCGGCGLGFLTQDASLKEIIESSGTTQLGCPHCGREAFLVAALYSDDVFERAADGSLRRRDG